MIRHIVFWKLKDTVEHPKAASMARIKAEMEALPALIPEIGLLEVRLNLRSGDDEFDLMLYSEFADAAALQVYMDHPAHKAASSFVTPVRVGRAIFDGES